MYLPKYICFSCAHFKQKHFRKNTSEYFFQKQELCKQGMSGCQSTKNVTIILQQKYQLGR
jgi:hypothetical protein